MSTKHPVTDEMEFPLAKRPRVDKHSLISLLSLPNEIKEEIFQHLAPNDLLNLMLTCKTFNSYVEDNKSLMDKFTVYISKLVASEVVSHRSYSRIYMDCEPSEEVNEIVKKSFIHINQCVKVIIISDKSIPAHSTETREAIRNNMNRWMRLVRDQVAMCPNYMTINLINGNESKVEAVNKIQTKVKTFNAFCFTILLPDFPGLEEINFYDGFEFSFTYPNFHLGELSKLKRINLFQRVISNLGYYSYGFQNGYSIIGQENSSVEEITVQDGIIALGFNLMFPRLKTLKLINCCTTKEPFDLILRPIDELHIENCGKLLWMQEENALDEPKIKHLKIINAKYPPSYAKTIESVRKNVETLTMINVTFEEEEDSSEEDDEQESSDYEEDESSDEDESAEDEE